MQTVIVVAIFYCCSYCCYYVVVCCLTIGRCEVQEDSDKVNCGYVGIIQTQCEAKGCCWKEPSVSGVPFCFHKVGESLSQ